MLQRFVFPRVYGIEQDDGEDLFQDVDPPHCMHQVVKALNIRFTNQWLEGEDQRRGSHEVLTSHHWFCSCGDL
jgi:hypothetical protein